MRLRSQASGESVVSDAPEGESPRSRWAYVTKWLYGLFLVGIVGLTAWYGFYTYFHYDGSGQIRVQRTLVGPERAGRIQKIWPSEGDAVLRGDSLVMIDPEEACEAEEGITDVEQDRRESRQRAEVLALRIQGLQRQLARKRRELNRLREREVLELDDTEPRQNRLEEDTSELKSTITQLRLQKQQARATTERLADVPRVPQDPGCAPFVVSAPYDGRVHRVHEDEFAVVDAGTPVLSLTRSTSSVVVLGYLNQDLTGHVQRGDTVSVYLPGGTTTRGVVQETYSTAQDFARVKYDIYEPYPTQLLTEVAPANQKVRQQWRKLDRTEVEIEGRISR